ncbi:Glutathionyl-hydroquinone reductase YqjG [Hartmannibacter diazotrophicus]|uniref:Glutathionyl-hydroquinone reductase YqjG n=1 Tax=Hartmannibacter diazotrophicus TaxID=1482074 RepID=A0A2C9D9Z1_9HYPH|nr:glutathione S-transferase family protein [Hartmannibacter diazotrophicus]SON56561.1 Glutathionyl-hydroquinone reductase YqjG [Hartmannibacter diazotrophicus]
MGLLIDGVWQDQWYDTSKTGGQFKREASKFRNFITADGSPGPTGEGGFKAEANRYHLYVSLACPWAHRTLIFRELKGLTDLISVTVVDPKMGSQGWTFQEGGDRTDDPNSDARRLYEVYLRADPQMTGRVTVPVLWDKKTKTIVSNESSEIIRMFDEAFEGLTGHPPETYPREHREEIDAVNARVYDTVNNGVYKAGFATTQDAYEKAVVELFESLDWLEMRLSRQRWLVGPQPTEADWRLFTTLIRFDPVYVGHFKCNLRRIADYPALQDYLRDLYQMPGIAGTVNFDHIKTHYYWSHTTINPTRIIPKGPVLDLDAPHKRDRVRAA